MTFHRYYDLLDYWEYRPPANEAIAAFIGIKPPIAPVVHAPIEEFKLIPE